MKCFKPLASVLLSVLMVFLSVPFVFGTETDSGACGPALQWSLTQDGTLRVFGSGEMTENPWADAADQILRVVLEPGVESICTGAFSDCTALETLQIPASVTKIDAFALTGCRALTDIQVAAENACFSVDAAGALFDKAQTRLLQYPGGRRAESYTLPETVTSIAPRAFDCAAFLRTLSLPAKLQSLGEDALQGCFHLTELVIPDAVTEIGPHALDSCFDLQTLSLGSGLTTISETALPRYGALQTITVNEENAQFSTLDGVLFNKAQTCLRFYPPARTETLYAVPEGVQTIARSAFPDNGKLRQLLLPASLMEIEPDALAHLYALTDLCTASKTAVSAASGFLRFEPAEGYDAPTLQALYYALRQWQECDALLLEEDALFARLSEITGEEITDFDGFDRLSCLAEDQAQPSASPEGVTVHAFADSAEAEYCEEHALPLQVHALSVTVRQTPASCEAPGETVLGCATCPLTQTQVFSALGHAYGAWTSMDADTHARICANDPTHRITQAHTWDLYKNLTRATCTESGSRQVTCSVCGAAKTEDTAPDPTNHADYGTHLVNKADAGCTTVGYTGDKVCDGCDAVIEAGSDIAPLGHNFDDWADNGDDHIRTCDRCGKEEYAEHTWDSGTAISVATCTTPGQIKYKCTLCIATKTEDTDLDPTNHGDYGTHLVNVADAGCLTTGYSGDKVCDGCGAVIEAGKDIAPLGHNFDDWADNGDDHIRTCDRCGEEEYAAHTWDNGTAITAATCTTSGQIKYKCTQCIATKTVDTDLDPTNHGDYGTHLVNAADAGCTTVGYTGDKVCDGCGAVIEAGEDIAPLGHNFDDWADNGDDHIRTCDRCGEEEYAAHTWNDGTAISVATCTAPGQIKYKCTQCIATKTEDTAPDPTNHGDYGTHLVNQADAGCLTAGYTGDKVCDGCGAVIEAGKDIAPLGHNFDDWADNGDNHIRTCDRCGEEEYAAHTWDNGTTISVATCTAPGKVKYKCTLCVATKTVDTDLDPTNHGDYGTHIANAADAGCTTVGYTGDKVCDGCGAVIEAGKDIAPLGHNFDDWADNGDDHIRTCTRCKETQTAGHNWKAGETVRAATCATEGSVKYTCSVCGAAKTEPTAKDPTNHADYGTHLVNAADAGCTTAGYSGDKVSDGCGAVLETGNEIKALGHSFGGWTNNGETHIRTCTRCKETQTAGHNWKAGETVRAATCATEGSVKYTCSVCDAAKTEPTAKNPTNHADYGTHLVNQADAGCTTVGYTGDKVCDGCGAVIEAGSEISSLGHNFDDWADNGETHIRTCTRCKETQTAGHNWKADETVRAATCATEGSVKYTCSVCVAAKTEPTAKDPTNHADCGTHLVNAADAGCTTVGYTGDTVCNGCEAVIEAGKEIAPLGHSYGDWTNNGENHIRTCTRCKETQTAAHNWGAATLVKSASCSDNGISRAVCSVCGAAEERILSKAPHTDSNDDGVCDLCGERLREEKSGGCPYCGQTHAGAFGWLVQIFHRILFALFGAK